MRKHIVAIGFFVCLMLLATCMTTTSKEGREQMFLSNSFSLEELIKESESWDEKSGYYFARIEDRIRNDFSGECQKSILMYYKMVNDYSKCEKDEDCLPAVLDCLSCPKSVNKDSIPIKETVEKRANDCVASVKCRVKRQCVSTKVACVEGRCKDVP